VKRAAAGLACCALVLLSACGVSTSGKVHHIDDDDVPFGLLDEHGGEAAGAGAGRSAHVCLLKEDRLVEVERRVRGGSGLLRIIRSLGELTPTEADEGLGTALPAADEVRAVKLRAGTAEVEFTADPTQTESADPLASVAQIVCTLTLQGGVGRVTFSLGGTPIEVPTATGALTGDPVSREDYESMLEP
jgi:hypothetical protein